MSLSTSHIPADADSPLPQGAENRDQILALLLRLSLDIALLPVVLLLLALRRAIRPRRAPGAWYLSESDQDELAALSPYHRRAVQRALAIIGWALAGHRNRGMRPHARPDAPHGPAPRPNCVPRAPPRPAACHPSPRIRRENRASRGDGARPFSTPIL